MGTCSYPTRSGGCIREVGDTAGGVEDTAGEREIQLGGKVEIQLGQVGETIGEWGIQWGMGDAAGE